MDDTDRKLLLLLTENPRRHFRELAKKLGISRQAVYNRIQALTKAGVISHAIAGISVSYLDAVPVAIFGISETVSMERTLDKLGESEFTRRVVVAGGNYLYVVGFLRDVSELDGYVEFVKRAADIPSPLVGIYCLDDGLMPGYSVDGGGKPRKNFKKLSALDMKIIASIRDDARKPIARIASEVGASSKTVRRHLEDMIADGSLDISMPSDSGMGGDHFLIMHVNLKDGADKRTVGRRLLSRRYFMDQYIRTHSNLPNLLAWVFWSDDISEVRRALRMTSEDEDVHSVMLNFAYLERVYLTTWRDKLTDAVNSSMPRARTRGKHSKPRRRR